MAFIVIELQKNADGSVGNIVNAYDDQEKAESAYYAVLSSAAVSTIPVHSAALITEEGFPLLHHCYKHG